MSKRCKERVFPPTRGLQFSRSRQCSRRAVKDGYCAQHHPDAVEQRRIDSMNRYRAEIESKNREYAKRSFDRKAGIALRLIAQGHNDPIGLARKTFADAGMHWDED